MAIASASISYSRITQLKKNKKVNTSDEEKNKNPKKIAKLGITLFTCGDLRCASLRSTRANRSSSEASDEMYCLCRDWRRCRVGGAANPGWCRLVGVVMAREPAVGPRDALREEDEGSSIEVITLESLKCR